SWVSRSYPAGEIMTEEEKKDQPNKPASDLPVDLYHDTGEEHLWTRQKGETEAAWQAFVVYRDMNWREKTPMLRSCSKVAKELGKSVTLIDRWSQRCDWKDRALAFDRYMDEQITDQNIWRIKEMKKRQAEYGRTMIETGMNKILSTPIDRISVRDALT